MICPATPAISRDSEGGTVPKISLTDGLLAAVITWRPGFKKLSRDVTRK